MSERASEILQFLHEPDEDTADDGSNANGSVRTGVNMTEIRVPTTLEERRYLGKAHLREALLLHEEAMRVNRMCRELRKKDVLQAVLRRSHDRYNFCFNICFNYSLIEILF